MVFTVDLDGELGHSVRNAFEARDVASNAFIDYEANAILVDIASLVVELVTKMPPRQFKSGGAVAQSVACATRNREGR